MTRVAAIQMVSAPEVSENLRTAKELIERAVAEGAQLIVLPENFACVGVHEKDKLKVKEDYGNGPIQAFLSNEAARHGIWLVGGTIPIVSIDKDKVHGTCLLYDAMGRCVARYDKIHLFDVQLGEEDAQHYQESATIEPGEDVVVAETPFGPVGLAVCYDLRFPELFRRMLDKGLEVIALPSAFTYTTGKAHWEPLLRARAVENLCYVIASNQGGHHANGRDTFGHTMIVTPWGEISAILANGPGVILADIDHKALHDTRRSFPSIEHRRLTD
ncbi:MAG: carbon-nitrogen hydrolase family protein [Gammaproteobacteria bacterium]|nr:carbon-nitrogen hydrolase family protein [Gammaproteobacteria bacterium]MCI0590872.1 carbon-nitrogen hydrolase family protein [Gammaproteobacteria bacterium]